MEENNIVQFSDSYYQRWTKEEDNILIDAVKTYPDNITYSCKIAALKLNRIEKSCSNRWYKKLRYREPCFMTVGKTKTMINNKNNPTKNGEYSLNKVQTTRKSLFKAVKLAVLTELGNRINNILKNNE